MAQTNRKPRNKSSADLRRAELAKIHIGKKSLGLDDESYRGMLFKITNKKSAGDLDAHERVLVLEYLKESGFKPRHVSAIKSGMHKKPSWERAPQLSKIGALIADMGLTWSYVDGIAKQMYKTDRVRWLYPNQLRGVIVALIKRQNNLQKRSSK